MSKRGDGQHLWSATTCSTSTGLVIVCPITNTDRGFPFHLAVPRDASVTGFVMIEQVKSVDHAIRRARFVERAPEDFVANVLDLIDACIR